MLRIVGDINFSDGFFDTGFGVGSSIRKGRDPFAKLKRNTNDYWIGNFECVCSNTSNKQGTSSRQFIITPKDISHIKHFNLYNVANNHVMQHGEIAYNEMLSYLEIKGVNYVGSENKKKHIFEHQEKKIGIIAFSQRPDNFSQNPLYWSMPEYSDVKKELEDLSLCDYKIVYVHWGNEFINYPYIDQKNFARYMIDCGADLIVGMHPHILQGFEVYKGKHIFYSIGNFVFNMPWEPTKYSIILNVDLAEEVKISYNYIKIEKDYFPNYVQSIPAEFQFESLNKLLSINEENEKYYSKVFNKTKEYRKSNYKNIISNLYKLKIKDMNSIVFDFIKRRL